MTLLVRPSRSPPIQERIVRCSSQFTKQGIVARDTACVGSNVIQETVVSQLHITKDNTIRSLASQT
jgi:hypothetical protein